MFADAVRVICPTVSDALSVSTTNSIGQQRVERGHRVERDRVRIEKCLRVLRQRRIDRDDGQRPELVDRRQVGADRGELRRRESGVERRIEGHRDDGRGIGRLIQRTGARQAQLGVRETRHLPASTPARTGRRP